MKITSQKKSTLRNIVASYEAYKGRYLDKLKSRLDKKQISNKELILEFESYTDYLLNILANTRKVFVKLDEEFNLTAEEYNKVFEDVE